VRSFCHRHRGGATIIKVPDTVGYTMPVEFPRLIRRVREQVVGDRNVTISVHCHDDLGLAVANTLAAIEAAHARSNVRSMALGNAPAMHRWKKSQMAMKVRADQLPFETAIQTQELYPTSQLLSSIIGCPVQRIKRSLDATLFAHEAEYISTV